MTPRKNLLIAFALLPRPQPLPPRRRQHLPRPLPSRRFSSTIP